ncbi:hypothetical protein BBBOND_0402320 [Babesia bigemina]|uniref:Uncharacterized protein n=1 Tax=Babesia bigemina TaxID=5866 RepID=A0A061DB25_BABBI|nr:hypothetical protein BBBOND_0402320 [Babesia bigemina]CDR97743.1 hypothetical protein BBBOND_0402320 [Babesia bigemina]|eukprot:XP_012769929.1 hypothetical protein BBBOND_0402320 [Babesia bigemina]
MAKSTLITGWKRIVLVVLVLTFGNGTTAQINVKRFRHTLNDDLRIYVNGQRTLYSEIQFEKEPTKHYMFALKYEHLKKTTQFLRDVFTHYQGLHPFKPYLGMIVEFYERKLAEANGSSFFELKPNELCAEVAGSLTGITDTVVELSPLYHLNRPDVIDAISCFRSAPVKAQEDMMDFWMLLYQSLYTKCSETLQNFDMENTVNGFQVESGVTTPASLRGVGDTIGYDEPAFVDLIEHESDEAPWLREDEAGASPCIAGSLGAWKPETDRSLEASDASGEMAGSSNDDRGCDNISGACDSRTEHHDFDSSSDSYFKPEKPEEDEDPLWDEYFASFLMRLKNRSDQSGSDA